MKTGKKLRKLISVLLCICLCAGIMIPAVSAASCGCPYDPIVYVYGKHELYFLDDDGNYVLDDNGNRINITDRPLDIGAIAKEMVPKFIDAYLNDSWDAYSEELLSFILPLYDGIGVDSDGMPLDTTHIGNDDTNVFGWFNGTTHGYHMGWNNYFSYDYRMSPVDIAAELNDYIEGVKANTGHDKVVIVARCQGCNILMSWLQQYQESNNFSSVSKIMLLDGCMNGLDYLEAMFSGTINPSSDAVYRLLTNEYKITDLVEGDMGELLALLVDTLKETYGIEKTISILKKAYEKLKDPLFAPWFRAFYGSCGSNLACVKDNFDECIDYLYPTAELKAEYKGVIEKAVYTNKNVTMRVEEILKNAEACGVKIGLIGEYGFQSTPLSPEADYCADSMTTLYNQTLGATCSEVDKKLSESYIAGQTEKGLGAYISADKQVDASTCAFPDTTWIIKNAKHEFSESIHVLVVRFLRDNITVSNQTSYPQFLNYQHTENGYGMLTPLQETNPNDRQWNNTASGLDEGEATVTLLQKIIDFLQRFLNTIVAAIKQIVASAKA